MKEDHKKIIEKMAEENWNKELLFNQQLEYVNKLAWGIRRRIGSSTWTQRLGKQRKDQATRRCHQPIKKID